MIDLDCATIGHSEEGSRARRSSISNNRELEEKYAYCIPKIVLPTSDYNEVEAFLDIAGQSHFGLFPDLEGLREQLMAEMDQEISAVRDHLTGEPRNVITVRFEGSFLATGCRYERLLAFKCGSARFEQKRCSGRVNFRVVVEQIAEYFAE